MDKNKATHDFKEIMSLANLFALIDRPTRICDTTATLIDNIIVGQEIKDAVTLVQNVDVIQLSDHKVQIVHIKQEKPKEIKIKKTSENELQFFFF